MTFKFKSCFMTIFTLFVAFSLSSCGDKTPVFSTETSIYYLAGDNSDWTYGNQQKEFPGDKNCYVRIGSTTVMDTATKPAGFLSAGTASGAGPPSAFCFSASLNSFS